MDASGQAQWRNPRAAPLAPDALQALMQHKDYQTTQRYINMARQLNPAVANLYVPPVAVTGSG